ncbi:MAG: hypothetical protein JW982_05915, partial [Spirochaetes bacterium]|nr:hypothetical protein [Spirochaetota bacterium]
QREYTHYSLLFHSKNSREFYLFCRGSQQLKETVNLLLKKNEDYNAAVPAMSEEDRNIYDSI